MVVHSSSLRKKRRKLAIVFFTWQMLILITIWERQRFQATAWNLCLDIQRTARKPRRTSTIAVWNKRAAGIKIHDSISRRHFVLSSSTGNSNLASGCCSINVTDENNLQSMATTTTTTTMDIDHLVRTWRDTPSLNPTFQFPCWRVPKHGPALQTILESPLTQPYLVSRFPMWEHVHRNRRPKVIQSSSSGTDDHYRLVLLRPNAPSTLPNDLQQLLRDCQVETEDMGEDVHVTLQLRPSDFTASYILLNLLPKEVHPPPTSFETIGHVAHLNLREIHLPYRHLIGQVLLETLPELKTVIHKVGQVSGPYRTYSHEILAMRSNDSIPDNHSPTVVSFVEWGVALKFDVKDVYWSSRLSQERRRLVQHEFRPGQWIADPFCGVGALCLQAALHKKCLISANDWNPAAIQALKANALTNKLSDSFLKITCGDAYEFLTGLGMAQRNKPDEASSESSSPYLLPHHVVMNFPLKAASFLGALRWWPVVGGRQRRISSKKKMPEQEAAVSSAVVVPRVHVYTFAKESENTTQSVEEMAVDEIASHLLPVMTGQGPSTGSTSSTVSRWNELDQNFGCNVQVHTVRDVAPGKVVLCVSFSATERLLRYMQGDYFYDSLDDDIPH